MFRRLFEKFVDPSQFIGLRLRIRLEKNGCVKFSQPRPKSCIAARSFCSTLQNFECFFFFSRRQLDFAKTLISLDVSRIQCDRPVRILDSLVRFLEILRIDKSELAVRLGVVRVCFDRVFQNVNRLWKIILPDQQSGHARREVGLTRIDIENFTIRFQRSIHLAVLLECHSFDKVRERPRLTLAFRMQNEVRGWLEIERIVLLAGFFYPDRRTSNLGS